MFNKSYRVLIGINDGYIVGAKGITKEEAEDIERLIKLNPKADVKIEEDAVA